MNAGCCCSLCCWLPLLVAAVDCCCWLLLLIAVAGCCCWLLLLVAAVDCCCWLLLLIAVAGCCCSLLLLVAAVDCCCWLENLWIVPDANDLRLKFFCSRKSLWIYSGHRWKVFEYFLSVDERKMEESFASGKLVVDGSKWMNIMAVHWVFLLDFSKMAAVWARANRIVWWELESGKVGSVEFAAKTSFEIVLE